MVIEQLELSDKSSTDVYSHHTYKLALEKSRLRWAYIFMHARQMHNQHSHVNKSDLRAYYKSADTAVLVEMSKLVRGLGKLRFRKGLWS